LTYGTGAEDAWPTSTAAELVVIGTFTQSSATTGIEVVWNSHVTGSGGGTCSFHIRVDGVESVPGNLGPTITSNGDYYPISTTDIFTGLAAGTHTVTVWDRGLGSTSCFDNPGNYPHTVIVTEYQS